jgi:hypothetical protein
LPSQLILGVAISEGDRLKMQKTGPDESHREPVLRFRLLPLDAEDFFSSGLHGVGSLYSADALAVAGCASAFGTLWKTPP